MPRFDGEYVKPAHLWKKRGDPEGVNVDAQGRHTTIGRVVGSAISPSPTYTIQSFNPNTSQMDQTVLVGHSIYWVDVWDVDLKQVVRVTYPEDAIPTIASLNLGFGEASAVHYDADRPTAELAALAAAARIIGT